VMIGHVEEVLCRIDRARRGLRGDHLTASETDQNPKRSVGPKRSGGWRSPVILSRDAKAVSTRGLLCEVNTAGGK
jgi:hypothetical protein